MNLCSLLPRQVRERPSQAAIIETAGGADRSISFAELDDASARAAALLEDAGVSRGDRVLLLVPMSIELYVALLGVLRLGAVVTLLDPSAGPGHIDRCCRMARPRALVGASGSQLLRLISAGLRSIPEKITLGARWLPGRPWRAIDRVRPRGGPAEVSAEDPALLTFTSGSTGRPKAAVRTHGLLLAQEEALAGALALEPGSRDWTTLPVFVLSNLAAGVASVIPDVDLRRPGAIDPQRAVAQIERHAPSSVVASPALLLRLAGHCAERGRTLPSFQKVFTGGAPVFWHTLDRLSRAMPGARVTAVYGSTEAEPIAEIALDQLSAEDRAATLAGKGLPAGAPVPQVRLRVIADTFGSSIGPIPASDLDRRTLGAEVIGEIVVTGRHVLKGYLNGEGDEETKFRAGDEVWHRTGDSGFIDGRGRLWLTGRCAGKIADERGVIYPLQVEAAAHSIIELRRAGLVQHRSERVLIVEPGASFGGEAEGRLLAELRWAGVTKVIPVPRIPVDRRHNAKIDYAELRRSL